MKRRHDAPDSASFDHSSVESEAAHWLVLVEDNTLTASQRIQLKNWLQSDPRHLQAYDRIRVLWRMAGAGSGAVVARSSQREFRPDSRTQLTRRRIAFAGLAACCALMFAILPSTPEREPVPLSYSSVHSPREVLLADGSRIRLDAATTVEALITQTRRELRLLTGQAVFDVTRDVHRPFRVIAGPMEIEVLGTIFNIDRSQPDAVSVTLLEGSLAVRVDKDRNGQRRMLAPGEQVSWNGLEGLSLASAKDVGAVAAWADGRVVFRGETLEQALARLNRYRPDPVKLPPDMNGDTTVFGVFRTGDADALIRALEGSPQP